MNNEKIYFKNLDAIRFIAALMVFLGHSLLRSYKYLPIDNSFFTKTLTIISDGSTGVSIFFVLSGFLITYLLISENEINSKISLRKFYLRRILRIWPLYFLVITFSFLVYPNLKFLLGINHQLQSNILYHITFLSNFDVINLEKYFQGFDATSQNITWSVAIEEQFYLFWPLLFLMPKRCWIYSIILVIICSIAFRLKNNNDSIILYFHTFSVLMDLAIGGLMASLIKSSNKIRLFFEKSSTLTHFTLFSISFLLLYFNNQLFAFKYANALSRIFTSFSFALIISAQAITKSKSKLNLHNFTFANKWGKYTYGIYLIHPIVLTLVGVVARTFGIFKTNFINYLLICVVSFVFTLLLSKISFKYFESKFMTIKNKFATL